MCATTEWLDFPFLYTLFYLTKYPYLHVGLNYRATDGALAYVYVTGFCFPSENGGWLDAMQYV